MNTLITIATCLLGSSILQGLGFYLYSAYYKKRNAKTYAAFESLSLAANSGNSQVAFQSSPTKQETGQKVPLPFDTFSFEFSGSGINSPQPNSQVILLKPQTSLTRQTVK